MRTQILIIALACMGWTVKAQDTLKTVRLDEVVVTGTKSEIPVEKSGKSIFKINREDIEASKSRNVADLLNQVPGVQMDGNFGPLGTNVGYFLRGASSRSTLILIDGVPFNDPSGIDQTYDLRLLDLDQIESIEVLKGGLSTLYGTGAAAGVINITLKKSSQKAFSGSAGVEYGSFNTVKTNLNLSGKADKVNYLINGGYNRSTGFSAAADSTGNNDFDDDGFEGYNFLAKLGYHFSNEFSMTLTGALDDFETDYDQGSYNDGDNTSDYGQIRLGVSPKFRWQGGNIRGEFFLTKLDRLFNSPDFFDPSARFIDEYDANNIQMDMVFDQNLTENVKLIGGINYQKLAYSQPDFEKESFNMLDNYLSIIYDFNSLNLQFGGRINQHSSYGSNVVWNVNPSYLIPAGDVELKVFGSYSTSFITPSLFQLFGPFGANTELKPEESKSSEGGVSINAGNIKLEGVYFYREDENLIIYTDQYENAGDNIKTDGIEFLGQLMFTKKMNLSANYTFVRRLDDSELYRIPSHKYGASLNSEPFSNLKISINYLRTGDRKQQYFDSNSFTTEEANLDAFNMLNFVASYLYRNFTLSGTLNNVLDEDYVAIYGFNSVGRNYNVGLKYNFN